MASRKTKFELRCFCRFHPLLATWGADEKNELYVHIKVFKGGHIYGDVVIGGEATVRLMCRECFRWHRVKLNKTNKVEMIEDSRPVLDQNT